MKVLMFGWEFPPKIYGGLAVASYGITKGLSLQGDIETTFCMPKPCGDEENKQAGPFKKRAKIEANTAPVEQEAEHHGCSKTEHCTERRPDTDILLKRRQQEKDRLQPFPCNGKKDHHHQRPAMMIPTLQCAIDCLFQLHFDVARHFTHPENHPGEDHHGNHRHDTFEQFLLFLRKFAGSFINEYTQPQAQRSG